MVSYLCEMKPELRAIWLSFIPGFLFVLLLSAVKYIEITQGLDFSSYGLFPRNIGSLVNIFTFPLIHDDTKHLYSNILPLFILMAMLFFFYREVAWRVFFFTWILHAIWLWIGGRPAFHIGASGVVYGLSSFLFFSGLWRRERRMMAVSLTVVFLYGGMVWGLFPFFIGTSWEAHLFGALTGFVLSWAYRKTGPQRVQYAWESEPDYEVPPEEQYWNVPSEGSSEQHGSEPKQAVDPFTLQKPVIHYEYRSAESTDKAKPETDSPKEPDEKN